MKSAKLSALAAAVALGLSAAPGAFAETTWEGMLTFDGPEHVYPTTDPALPVNQGGGEDKFEDDSVTAWVDNGDGVLGAGDYVYGIVTMSDRIPSVDGTTGLSTPVGEDSQLAIVFSGQLTNECPTCASPVFNVVPIGDTTNDYDLRNLLDAGVLSGISNTTIGVVLSSTTGVDNTNPEDDPLNWSAVDGVGIDDYFGELFTNANNWVWEATLDMLADPTPNDGYGGDFFYFQQTGAFAGNETGAFTITSQAFNTNWLPTDVIAFAVSDVNGDGVISFLDETIHVSDATLFQAVVGAPSDAQLAKGWKFGDQSSYVVNPYRVPEPSTLALLGLGLAAAGFARRRRNA